MLFKILLLSVHPMEGLEETVLISIRNDDDDDDEDDQRGYMREGAQYTGDWLMTTVTTLHLLPLQSKATKEWWFCGCGVA